MSDRTNKYYIILTDLGRAMVAEAIGQNTLIDLKAVAVGQAEYEPSAAQTALMAEKARVAITDKTIDDANPAWLRLSAILPPDIGGWHIHEIGVFAANGNLFAIGKMDGSYKPVYADGLAKEVQLDVILEVGNASSINLVVDPHAIIATRNWVKDYVDPIPEKLEKSIDALALATKNSLDNKSDIGHQHVKAEITDLKEATETAAGLAFVATTLETADGQSENGRPAFLTPQLAAAHYTPMPRPNLNYAVGHFEKFNTDTNGRYTVPPGGTWLLFLSQFKTGGDVYSHQPAQLVAGGTVVKPQSGYTYTGAVWRLV